EAGLTLSDLLPVANYYPSPGALSEYLYNYVGLCDLSAHAEGTHGLASEAEDIRTHILPFDEAFALIASGEADNGPLILSLMWVAQHRVALRSGG
ncbi:MAG: tellurium resistance protein, partial [Pseudomonadota bacterium]